MAGFDEVEPDDLVLEPRPDEDAWEAFVDLALERIDSQRSPGLTNRNIAEIESVIGHRLPFEVGLLLVMGVPAAEPWHQWNDPATDWAAWNERIHTGIRFDIEHDDFWFHQWGPRPDAIAQRLDQASEQFADTVPPLFPIYGHRAIPLTIADNATTNDANPILSVYQTDVIVYGDDLAAWMHREFNVPLPLWPAEERTFPFWSELS